MLNTQTYNRRFIDLFQSKWVGATFLHCAIGSKPMTFERCIFVNCSFPEANAEITLRDCSIVTHA
ncbi:hypothetical protein EDE08_109221 [Bradyrhizobium sp. R2.2-H]|jgi:hypothetical protein|nr:hypothetical protein EDE10_109192 [Bradyrhizobium sp. Y-H1]TCU70000.1 hypothetical protein EDE08_109221 [Bradyrhizobium sp. R2.2-H]